MWRDRYRERLHLDLDLVIELMTLLFALWMLIPFFRSYMWLVILGIFFCVLVGWLLLAESRH